MLIHRVIRVTLCSLLAMSCALAAVSLAGCSSGEDLVPAPVTHTPLELDPTEDLTIGAWWVGADRLIQLRRDGTYSVYAGGTRYSMPIEFGRWSRHGTYVIRLAPYQPLDATVSSLRMNRVDGRLVAQRPGEERLYAQDFAPPAAEDAFVGLWRSDVGVLRLNADLSYSVSPRSDQPQSDRPRAFLRHQGMWTLTEDVLSLSRTSPEVATEILRIETTAKEDSEPVRRLIGGGTTYELIEPADPGS